MFILWPGFEAPQIDFGLNPYKIGQVQLKVIRDRALRPKTMEQRMIFHDALSASYAAISIFSNFDVNDAVYTRPSSLLIFEKSEP
jgi:hypothetical protein